METLNSQEERLLEKGIIYTKRRALLADLKALEEGLPNVEVNPDKSWWMQNWPWLLLGAFLTLGLLTILSRDKSPTIPQQPTPIITQPAVVANNALFQKHFTPFEDIITTLGEGDKVKQRAFDAYNARDYEAAIPLLEAWYEIDKNPIAYLYQGNAHLALGQPDQAITKLELFKMNSSNFTSQANWYLVLAYLLKKDVAKIEELSTQLEGKEQAINEILQQLISG